MWHVEEVIWSKRLTFSLSIIEYIPSTLLPHLHLVGHGLSIFFTHLHPALATLAPTSVRLWQSSRLTITKPTILTQKFAPSTPHTPRRQPGVKFYWGQKCPEWILMAVLWNARRSIACIIGGGSQCQTACPWGESVQRPKTRGPCQYTRSGAAKGCSQKNPHTSYWWQINMLNWKSFKLFAVEWVSFLEGILHGHKNYCHW